MSARTRGPGRRGKAGLNRAVLDASFGELRRQLAYKCEWYGSRLVVAGRWYPSSKTCSACGAAKAKLPLSQRSLTCEACGLVGEHDTSCLRCGSALHPRKPNSLHRTWAMVFAAAILYIPANAYPVLTVIQAGSGQPSTIIDGIEDLIASHM
jgi:uncharacterized paraquat-inducible protein A